MGDRRRERRTSNTEQRTSKEDGIGAWVVAEGVDLGSGTAALTAGGYNVPRIQVIRSGRMAILDRVPRQEP
jgi:hypothetical protein